MTLVLRQYQLSNEAALPGTGTLVPVPAAKTIMVRHYAFHPVFVPRQYQPCGLTRITHLPLCQWF
jgi:hypothetical protein